MVHSPGPLQMQAEKQGPVHSSDFGTCFAICAEQQNFSKPQHHPEDAQRGGGPCAPGPGRHCRETWEQLSEPRTGPELQYAVILTSSPSWTKSPRTQTPPDASVRQSVSLPAVVRRFSSRCFTGTVSSAAASENNLPPPRAVGITEALTPTFLSVCCSSLSVLLPSSSVFHLDRAVRIPTALGRAHAHSVGQVMEDMPWRNIFQAKTLL